MDRRNSGYIEINFEIFNHRPHRHRNRLRRPEQLRRDGYAQMPERDPSPDDEAWDNIGRRRRRHRRAESHHEHNTAPSTDQEKYDDIIEMKGNGILILVDDGSEDDDGPSDQAAKMMQSLMKPRLHRVVLEALFDARRIVHSWKHDVREDEDAVVCAGGNEYWPWKTLRWYDVIAKRCWFCHRRRLMYAISKLKEKEGVQERLACKHCYIIMKDIGYYEAE
ncbi:hypothetical protein F4779DRAFT_620898 [Xylariaceae sp. FL0662B]|nr:hypothetical protein F4779DRAFT_620898 [Xylariaceae sp. FL0662B]